MTTRTDYAPGTPSWVDLSSTDVDAAKPFYAALFGWDLEDFPAGDEGVYTMASRGGNTTAGMMAMPPMQAEHGMPSAWNTYVTVTDADASLAAAEKAGGQVIAPVMDVMEAGRMAVISDPTGGVCSVWEPKEHIGAQLVNEHGALTWTDLMTSDPVAAGEFYAQLFGWDAHHYDSGEMGAGAMFTLNGAPIASTTTAPEGIPTHWSVYFHVDDCDACAGAITANGGQIAMGPLDIPPGRMVAGVDPSGGNFNAIQTDPNFNPMG